LEVWVEVTGGALVVVGFVVGGCTGPLADVGCGTDGCVLGCDAGFEAALVVRGGGALALPVDEAPAAGAPGPFEVPV